MVHLKVYDGHEQVEVLELKEEILSVGRDPECGLLLPDPSVSRHHAQIEPKGNFYLIRDHGSTNGTFVNEMLVRLQVLSHGDTVRIGKYLIHVDAGHSVSSDTTRVRVEKLHIDALSELMSDDAEAERAEEHSQQRWMRLHEIYQEIGHVDTTESLLERALEIILEELQADAGSFLLFPDSTTGAPDSDDGLAIPVPVVVRTRRRTELVASSENGTPSMAAMGQGSSDAELIIPQEFLQQACRSESCVEFTLPESAAVSKSGVTCLTCALRDKFYLRGVVYIERKLDYSPFTDGDKHFLATLASQISISLTNAQLFTEISASQEKTKEIFSGLTHGILVTDADLRIVEANTAATVLLEVDRKNLLGESLRQLLEKFEVTPALKVVRASAAHATEIFHVTTKKERDGEEFTSRVLAAMITAFPRESVSPRGFVIILRDRSDSWRMEHLKSQFIENVAHKLRTPLTVIQANLPLLRESSDLRSDTVRGLFDEIERNSTILCRLVDRFVDFAELDPLSNLGPVTPDSVDVKQLLHDLVLSMRDEADARDVSIVERCADDLPPITGYQGRLSGALFNILDNAIKFSPAGQSVTVEASLDQGYVRIDVSDRGPGIPPTEIESVFYIGHQIDADNAGQVPGAGLGLVLARHIVQEHGGEVSITSPQGDGAPGTRVAVLLPQTTSIRVDRWREGKTEALVALETGPAEKETAR